MIITNNINGEKLKMKKIITLAIALSLSALFQGCGDDGADTEKTIKPSDATLPATLLLKDKPANAISVIEARKQLKKGESVVIAGDIGARMVPFVENRAAFILADENNILDCGREGCGCKTPWDYCGETPEKIAESILMVQVLDDKGKIIKKSLKGFNNLKELSKVIVVGTVDETSTKDNVIINATGIYKVK